VIYIKQVGNKQGYIIHKVTNNNYCLCKILKEYSNIEDTKKDLIKLLSNNITEKELIKESKGV
jgi:hypothetical protein